MNYKKYFLFLIVFLGLYQFVCPEHSLIGNQAPQFKAQAIHPDGIVFDFDLKDYVGKLIVLYFYPMDSTPGCTKQAKNFRDGIARLRAHDIEIIGISCDSIESHKKFQQKHNLPFSLVSDSRLKRTISKLYGAAGFLYSKRKTFLINQEGVLVAAFDNINIENQITDILKAFKI